MIIDSDIFESARNFWGGEANKGNLIWPNEEVIRFVRKNYPKPDSTVILDYGCGGGRDTVALCTYGYKMIALDYAEEALELVREKCKVFGNNQVTIVKNKDLEIPLEDRLVDAVIADGSLFLNAKRDICTIVTELKRVLKDGGLLWANFRSISDSLCGQGEEIDDGLFVMNESTGRKGCTYFFSTERDIREIFEKAGLSVISIDTFLHTENNHQTVNNWYYVIARK